MTRKREHGRAVSGPVNHPPELVLDMSSDRPLPSTLGKIETPVNILPELAFDLRPAGLVPALQLSLHLLPGAMPTQAALDLFRLYAMVNQLELSQLGAGLVLEEPLCDAAPTNEEIRITLRPANPSGAVERLSKIVSIINGTAGIEPGIPLTYRSIDRCEAKLVQVAT